MEEEIWKDVKGYKGFYKISNYGRVMSTYGDEPFIRKPVKSKNGYYRVNLCVNDVRKYVSVHRLVAIAFCRKRKGCDIVNHKDSDRTNNFYKNLEWVTQSYNVRHFIKKGRNTQALSKRKPILRIKGNKIKMFVSMREADALGFDRNKIRDCCNNKRLEYKGYVWTWAQKEKDENICR